MKENTETRNNFGNLNNVSCVARIRRHDNTPRPETSRRAPSAEPEHVSVAGCLLPNISG